MRCRRKFLSYFPGAFRDETYVASEREYKAQAAERWRACLEPGQLRSLLKAGAFLEVARRAVAVESRTNLLFSFEKMALRDALKSEHGARQFAEGLLEFVTAEPGPATFERWCERIAELPRRQTRVLTWPLVTVFGFLARPDDHLFLKPNVTRRAARAYGFDFQYTSRPAWATYESLLGFARQIRRDVRDLRPRDMIDLQSFIWVQGSDEYP